MLLLKIATEEFIGSARTTGAALLLASLIIISPAQSDEVFDTFDQGRQAALERCHGHYNGQIIDEADIERLIADHQRWLGVNRLSARNRPTAKVLADPLRANLCGAVLRDSIDLHNARLDFADFSGASLNGVSLAGVSLYGADLRNAFASRADLSKAGLNTASLHGAYLAGAHFDGAGLAYVDFGESFLLYATMSNAGVTAAKFDQAIFEIEPGTLPRLTTLISISGLATLRFETSEHALLELREAYKKMGARRQEREVTFAIKSGERKKAGPIESTITYVAFELTTKWGLDPSRALVILLLLSLVFAIPYMIALRLGGGDGIWLIWPESRIRKDIGLLQTKPLRVAWPSAVLLGFYFSLLSAFRIGWRELSLGDWISRLQPQECTFAATGWVRTISGLQSLSSVYLVAICVLTYFGRPFD